MSELSNSEKIERLGSEAERNPQNIELLMELGALYEEEGEYDESILCYMKAQIIDPQDVDIRVNIGGAHFRAGELEKAKEVFMRCTIMAPNYYRGWANLAAVAVVQQEIKKAVEYTEKALELVPPEKKEVLGSIYGNLGGLYSEMSDFPKATKNLEKALSFYPEDVVILYNLGVMYQKRGMFDKAIEYFDRAIVIDPEYTATIHHLGMIYHFEKQDFKRAIKCYEIAIDQNTDTKYILLHYIGLCYQEMGDNDKAIESYQLSIGESSSSPSYNNIALIYEKLSMDDMADMYYNKAMKNINLEEYPIVHYNRGLFCFRTGESARVDLCLKALSKSDSSLFETLKLALTGNHPKNLDRRITKINEKFLIV